MRATVTSIATLLLITIILAGCDRPAATTHHEATTLASEQDTQSIQSVSDSCTEGDIQCDERLYQLEETLFEYEGAVTQRLSPAAQTCWTTDRETFRQTLNSCNNTTCKEDALLKRIASLHLLQEQSQRAALELPTAPLLIGVLPPDTENDEPSVSSELFTVSGALIHATAHPEHMGIAVQANGQDHVFILEMDIDNHPEQNEVLGLIGTSPTTQVLVRGYRQVAVTGTANFDSSQCRWVYEVPR